MKLSKIARIIRDAASETAAFVVSWSVVLYLTTLFAYEKFLITLQKRREA